MTTNFFRLLPPINPLTKSFRWENPLVRICRANIKKPCHCEGTAAIYFVVFLIDRINPSLTLAEWKKLMA